MKGIVNDVEIPTKAKIFKDYFGKILNARNSLVIMEIIISIYCVIISKLYFDCFRKLLTNPR